jgi:cell division protein ZapB
MSEYTIEELYAKVDRLIRHCERLQANNEQLHVREQQWLQERTRLVEKNELARTRVEAMIGHLKNLQQGVG